MVNRDIKLTFQKSKRVFKKCVGTYLHTDGEPRAKVWWLTGNHGESVEMAEFIIGVHLESVVHAGLQHWTPELIEKMRHALTLVKGGVARKIADDRLKVWLVLGLNCSFGPMELSTLKRSEIHFGANPHIARFRQKTNVYGKWTLWPETVELLKANMQKKGDLALLNEVGSPLIIESIDGRRDAILRPWHLLVKSADVGGSFKLLRKTGAWMIKKIAGLEESEMMLAHTEGSETGTGKMNKAYAGRDWDKLAAALTTMRNQLLAAGVLSDKVETNTEAKAA